MASICAQPAAVPWLNQLYPFQVEGARARTEVQAILLATDRDLPPAERDSIDGSISKEFTLKRDQRKALTTVEDD